MPSWPPCGHAVAAHRRHAPSFKCPYAIRPMLSSSLNRVPRDGCHASMLCFTNTSIPIGPQLEYTLSDLSNTLISFYRFSFFPQLHRLPIRPPMSSLAYTDDHTPN